MLTLWLRKKRLVPLGTGRFFVVEEGNLDNNGAQAMDFLNKRGCEMSFLLL